MILAVVTFRLPAGTTREDAAAMFRQTAPLYAKLPGLVRKQYLYRALDTHVEAGGAYSWETRAAAEAGHGAEWLARVTAKYGAPPEVRFFDTPVSVDNTGASAVIAEHAPA
ncbi:MAG TPA: hypothetical protein VGN96_14480 [Roseococcus sp.]|jgi:23S rRNA A2030 N6-methylase RlmJ|nr:hypothetical protein [Roseococcus sp.]